MHDKKDEGKIYWENQFKLLTVFGCEASDKNMANIILSI
jgi:hypothetical protein